MGVFITHKKSNYETIESITIEYRGIDVTFKLKEWDLYERILVFRDTHRREGITVVAQDKNSYDPIGGYKSIASETLGWNKGRGPSHDLTFQIRHAWNEVKAEVDEYLDRGEELGDAVNGVVDIDEQAD